MLQSFLPETKISPITELLSRQTTQWHRKTSRTWARQTPRREKDSNPEMDEDTTVGTQGSTDKWENLPHEIKGKISRNSKNNKRAMKNADPL
eukprot:1068200-Ditylum_brightwellii.AAC.1